MFGMGGMTASGQKVSYHIIHMSLRLLKRQRDLFKGFVYFLHPKTPVGLSQVRSLLSMNLTLFLSLSLPFPFPFLVPFP